MKGQEIQNGDNDYYTAKSAIKNMLKKYLMEFYSL